jgi:hypothetical protein
LRQSINRLNIVVGAIDEKIECIAKDENVLDRRRNESKGDKKTQQQAKFDHKVEAE